MIHDKLFYLVTTRVLGNLSYRFDKECIVKERYEKLATILRINPNRILSLRLEGKDRVYHLNRLPKEYSVYKVSSWPTADAVVTSLRNVYISVIVADCYVVTLYDFLSKTLSMIHVGSKGAELEIIKKTFLVMQELYSVLPQSTIALVSPGITQDSYIYSPPGKFSSKGWQKFVRYLENNKVAIDLRGRVVEQIKELGIGEERIFLSDSNVAEDSRFFSHVRSLRRKEKEGRFAVIAAILA